MKTIKVRLQNNSYNIMIGSGILPQLGAKLKSLRVGCGAVVISNSHIRGLFGQKLVLGLKKQGFSVKFFDVPDSERSKSLKTAFELLEKIAAYDTRKEIFVVALGGGVVGDLAGFVAAIYKRGVPYIQIPTTFLGQIDSAIGGKTAVDLSVGKNLAGAFHQPKLVYSDIACLQTLPARQIRNGLSEAVKYGVIQDKKLFEFIESHVSEIFSLDTSVISEIVLRCSKIKARIVACDEKETKGIRTILNFGHTVGHAIEAAGGFRAYQHGEAIALGMRVASRLACQLGLLRKDEAARLENLLTALGLPAKIRGVSLKSVLSLMMHDKKFKSGKTRFVLPTAIGAVRVVEGVPLSLIHRAIRERM